MTRLYFVCPTEDQGFWSAAWAVDEDMRVAETPEGGRQLLGLVRVPCPLCGESHAYVPGELACPLQAPRDAASPDRSFPSSKH